MPDPAPYDPALHDPALQDIDAYYYSRYGLADVLAFEMGASRATARDVLAGLSAEAFAEAATRRLASLRRTIRVQFQVDNLTPRADVAGTLVREPSGQKGAQTSAKGFYTRPHVLVDAKSLGGLLGSYVPTKGKLLQRYYPPASRLSVGKKSASNVSFTTAFVLACQVTTLTTAKAARKDGTSDRVAAIPDLPLGNLLVYLRIFDRMQRKGTSGTRGRVYKNGEGVRLLDNDGNFPEAPPAWAFGSLGVLASIGTWMRDNRQIRQARPVLDALAGQRVYVISTSGTSRVETAGQHLVRLARTLRLAPILRDAWRMTTNAEQDELYRVFRRWLLQFDAPSFRDVLAVRAQYPPSFRPLLDAYFMPRFDADLIASARLTGQHIGTQAYFAADGEPGTDARRTNTQTILASLESLLYDCEDGPEMIARLSVQVGRLTGSRFPPASELFFDQVTSGALDVTEARHLLLAYLRLRKPPSPSSSDGDGGDDGDADGGAPDGGAPDDATPGADSTVSDALAAVESL